MMRRDPGGSWACLPPVYDYKWKHTDTSAEHAPKSSWEKRRGLQNAEKKLVPGFLDSVNHTGSPRDELDIHSYFIPGQNNK